MLKLILLITLCFSCGAPVIQDDASICAENMQLIAAREREFYQTHYRYTPDIRELGLSDLMCCGRPYYMAVNTDESEIAIMCPCGHGEIKSWLECWRKE